MMVLTVFGTVAVTAQAVNVQKPLSPLYVVTPPLPNVWGERVWNYQDAEKYASPGATSSADISGRTLTATASAGESTGARVEGESFCAVGVNWYLNPCVNWDAVKSKPVLVTVLLGYKVAGSGSGKAVGDVLLEASHATYTLVHKDTTAASYSVNQPFKVVQFRTTLSQIGVSPGYGYLHVFAGAFANAGIVTSPQSSTQVTVYSVGLQWA